MSLWNLELELILLFCAACCAVTQVVEGKGAEGSQGSTLNMSTNNQGLYVPIGTFVDMKSR